MEKTIIRPQLVRKEGLQRTITPKVKMFTLGGLGEYGKNLTVFEYQDQILIVDMGIAFPEQSMLGIDFVIPDTKYLEDNKQKIRGIIITHFHEDHVGGIPYIWPKLGAPIFTTKLTAGLIQSKVKEFSIMPKIVIVKSGDIVPIGPFKVEFLALTHSVPDAIGLAIHSPVGLIVYMVDWKIDHTPVNGQRADWARIAELGGKGVLALFSDSTRADRPGYTVSESVIGESIDNHFKNAKGRVIVTSFGSQINRIQQVINAAVHHNRRLAIIGHSMVNNVDVAAKLGYIKLPANTLIDIREISRVPDDKVTIMCTGSQGEEYSALVRMATGTDRNVKIKKGDTVIISASPIPGNERAIGNTIDNLYREGATVIYGSDMDVHVGGHASQEELKMLISLVKPKYFVPVHGEYRMLVKHTELAQTLGVPEENTFVMDNGQVLEFGINEARLSSKRIPVNEILIDGSGIGDVGNIVIRDRQAMSKDGIFVVIMTVDKKTGRALTSPDIISRGFVYMRQAEELIHKARQEVKTIFTKLSGKYQNNWDEVKKGMRDQLSDFLFANTQRRPMIIPVIIEISKTQSQQQQ